MIGVDFRSNVMKLKGLQLFDVSPWSQWNATAKKLMGSGIAAEVRMHPVKEVILADETHMREKLTKVRETFEGIPVTVRADGLGIVNSMERDLPKMIRWCRIADEILHQRPVKH